MPSKGKNSKKSSKNAAEGDKPIVIEDGNESENEVHNDEEMESNANDEEMDNNQEDNEDEDNDENDNEEEEDENNDSNNKESVKEAKHGIRGRKKKSSSSSNNNHQSNRGRTKQRDNRYRVYLFKILQQVHPKVGITKTAMDIVNSFIEDMFERICVESMRLCQNHSKSHTIGAREIQTAARLILPGELQKHALLEGQKAVEMFEKNSKALQVKRQKARMGQ